MCLKNIRRGLQTSEYKMVHTQKMVQYNVVQIVSFLSSKHSSGFSLKETKSPFSGWNNFSWSIPPHLLHSDLISTPVLFTHSATAMLGKCQVHSCLRSFLGAVPSSWDTLLQNIFIDYSHTYFLAYSINSWPLFKTFIPATWSILSTFPALLDILLIH